MSEVDSVTAPVRPATDVTGAEVRYPWPFTKAVVASVVELSDSDAVGAAGTPVKVGDASGAFRAKAFERSVCELMLPEMEPQVLAPEGPAGPVAPVAPVSPCGMVKLRV